MSAMDKNKVAELAKHWVTIDKELVRLRGVIRERRKRQNAISTELWKYAKTTNTTNLSQGDGALRFKKKVGKKSISLKWIRAILLQYHKGDEKSAQEETQFILDKRDVVTRETIVWKGNKEPPISL